MKVKILLFFIIIIAIVLRFYQLGQNPPSLTWDEAAWGYNAYSLGIDGRDEFGRFLPYDYLESFGDFKPPVYAYLDILPVKIFGLNAFATRFPSAFFGTLTVLVTFLLVKRIFYNSKYKNVYALMSSFVLALSPWHIMLSRAAFEANIATFFLASGIWLFLAGVLEKKWCLLLSIISFALAVYTFNTARVVAPMLIIVLAIVFRNQLLQRRKAVIIAGIVGMLFILPIAKFLLSPQASLRFREVNIFSDIGVIETTNQEIVNDNNAAWSKILHNRRFAYGVAFINHYFDNVSPYFLFIKGDGNPKFSTQDVGELYLWDLPFFIVGIFLLFKKKEGYWFIIPIWLLLGIIPAATARETPHALRIEATLPTFQILTAYGFIWLLSHIQFHISNFTLQKSLIVITFCLLFINVFYFQHGYYIHYPREFSKEWQYGYEQSIAYVQQVTDKYHHIYITHALGRPYIYYLFYMKINPQFFRKEAVIQRNVFGFVTVEGFGKYQFYKDMNDPKNKKKDALYVNVPDQVPQNANIAKTFYLLNGEKTLVAYRL